MGEVTEFKYLGTLLYKHRSMEDVRQREMSSYMREKEMNSRQVTSALESYERKKCDYGSKKWQEKHHYPLNSVICIKDIDMAYSTTILHQDSGITIGKFNMCVCFVEMGQGGSNENVYKRPGVGVTAKWVVKWLKW